MADASRFAHAPEVALFTISQAMTYLNLSRSKLYELMDDGELEFVKIGKSRRIRKSHLDTLIERHTQRAG